MGGRPVTRIEPRHVPPTITHGSGLTREYVDGPLHPMPAPKSDMQIALRLAACLALGATLFVLLAFAAAALP